MKKLIFFLLVCILLQSCESRVRDAHIPSAIQQIDTTPVLELHLNDFTLSTSSVVYWNDECSKNLYYDLAQCGGTIKFLRIDENSNAHNVHTINVEKLYQQPTEGVTNVYKLAKIKAGNKKLQAAFDVTAQQQLAEYNELTNQPHRSKFTDLQACLALAQTTLREKIYEHHRKYLIISSDCINDEQHNRHVPLQPIHLDNNVTVLVIRPLLSEKQLQRVFPDCKELLLFTSPQDAVSFINNSKN